MPVWSMISRKTFAVLATNVTSTLLDFAGVHWALSKYNFHLQIVNSSALSYDESYELLNVHSIQLRY